MALVLYAQCSMGFDRIWSSEWGQLQWFCVCSWKRIVCAVPALSAKLLWESGMHSQFIWWLLSLRFHSRALQLWAPVQGRTGSHESRAEGCSRSSNFRSLQVYCKYLTAVLQASEAPAALGGRWAEVCKSHKVYRCLVKVKLILQFLHIYTAVFMLGSLWLT